MSFWGDIHISICSPAMDSGSAINTYTIWGDIHILLVPLLIKVSHQKKYNTKGGQPPDWPTANRSCLVVTSATQLDRALWWIWIPLKFWGNCGPVVWLGFQPLKKHIHFYSLEDTSSRLKNQRRVVSFCWCGFVVFTWCTQRLANKPTYQTYQSSLVSSTMLMPLKFEKKWCQFVAASGIPS